jgi:MFS-type transporter involved in bile tolerance (Atg22 family)
MARALPAYGDLSLFIVVNIFLAAAASTALSAASIIATNVLHASPFYLAAATSVGVIAAIVGLLVFRTLVDRRCLSVKHALIINCVVIAGAMVYVLYAKSVTDLFVVAAIAGSQVGPINAFARSIVSRLTPSHEQSRFFSLYEFSQESTGWIGPLIVASVTQSGGGSGTVFARTSVFTCLVELGVAVLLLMPIDNKRGVARRDGCDVDVRQPEGGDDTKKPPSSVVGLDGVVVGASAAGPGATKPYGRYQDNSSSF